MTIMDRLDTGRAAVKSRWTALPRWLRFGVIALAALAAYGLPNINTGMPVIGFFTTSATDWSTTLFTIALYVLLTVGLNVVVGYAGLLDLGYVGFFAVGAYTVALLTSPNSNLKVNWGWMAAVPIAIGIAMASGVLLGWPTLRLRGDYLAIVTLGFAEIIRIAADSSSLLNGDRGIPEIPHPPGKFPDGSRIFGVTDAKPYYWLALTLIIVVIFGVRNLERSRVGRSWVAIREDEDAAAVMGVPTFKFKLWAFAIGASIGGLSGALFAGEQGFINSTTFQLLFSILVLAGVVLGGSGNIPGAIFGGFLIAWLPEWLRGLNVKIFGTEAFEYRYLIFGLLLLVMMIFRPQGVIASRRKTLELKDREEEVPVGE